MTAVIVVMFTLIRSIVEYVKDNADNPDPIKVCKIYKTIGCAHVDGPECNPRTCAIKVVAVVTPTCIKEKQL